MENLTKAEAENLTKEYVEIMLRGSKDETVGSLWGLLSQALQGNITGVTSIMRDRIKESLDNGIDV